MHTCLAELRTELLLASLLCAIVGCGSNGKAQSPSVDAGEPVPDAKGDLASDRARDLATTDLPPRDYFLGQCRWPHTSSPVPVDAGALPHGLTVLTTGLPSAVALEVDATNAYFATAAGIYRLPLAGGTPVEMVVHASPVATAVDADSFYWSDSSVTGQTTILRVPLTAQGWQAFSGDGGAAQSATVLASAAGSPGAFTLADGTLYFVAGTTVLRVAASGGAAQTVITGIAPTGMAVGSDRVYLGDDPGEAIKVVDFAGKVLARISSNATPSEVALSGNDLYWGDWFGSIEHATIGDSIVKKLLSVGGCSVGACSFHLKPTPTGAAYAAAGSDCGNIGVTVPDRYIAFAYALSPIVGIAVASNHLYAMTSIGELLRWDL